MSCFSVATADLPVHQNISFTGFNLDRRTCYQNSIIPIMSNVTLGDAASQPITPNSRFVPGPISIRFGNGAGGEYQIIFNGINNEANFLAYKEGNKGLEYYYANQKFNGIFKLYDFLPFE